MLEQIEIAAQAIEARYGRFVGDRSHPGVRDILLSFAWTVLRGLARNGGKAGKGASKRRGDSAYYKALRALPRKPKS